jgi:hypothetical protein
MFVGALLSVLSLNLNAQCSFYVLIAEPRVLLRLKQVVTRIDLQPPKTPPTEKHKLAGAIKTKKTLFLVAFAVVYGLVFINYIDIITNGGSNSGYHLWLVLMYFVPFAILSVLDIKNWKLTLGLGLLASVMNDVFYGAMRTVMGFPLDLANYYNLWLIPQNKILFTMNLGFTTIPVESWMMATSIYLRFGAIFALLEGYKHLPNLQLPTYVSLRRQKVKVGGLKPTRQYEPEIFFVMPESEEIKH